MLNLDNIFSIEWFGIKKKEEELKKNDNRKH